jgi:hypothetical protein
MARLLVALLRIAEVVGSTLLGLLAWLLEIPSGVHAMEPIEEWP